MLVIIQIQHDIEDNNITLYFYQQNMEVFGCEKKVQKVSKLEYEAFTILNSSCHKRTPKSQNHLLMSPSLLGLSGILSLRTGGTKEVMSILAGRIIRAPQRALRKARD